MACDIKFAMFCWQDKYGSDNALANIFVDGNQVATNVEITATSEGSAQCVTFEVTDQADVGTGRSADIKVVLTNSAYVDSDNDRNIWINGLYAVDKGTSDSNYKYLPLAQANGNGGALSNITDWSSLDNYVITGHVMPSAVTGSQIASDWWAGALAASSDGSFWHVPVWGDPDNVGTTITLPLVETYQDID